MGRVAAIAVVAADVVADCYVDDATADAAQALQTSVADEAANDSWICFIHSIHSHGSLYP